MILFLPLYGTVHILRKQRYWVGGSCKMLMFAYIVGGWVLANAYISKTFMYSEKKLNFSLENIVKF